MAERSSQPRILIFSSGNPAASFLAAGLLHDQHDLFGAAVIEGTGDAVPAPEVARSLAELGIDLGDWVPDIRSGPLTVPIEIGLTICVPT